VLWQPLARSVGRRVIELDDTDDDELTAPLQTTGVESLLDSSLQGCGSRRSEQAPRSLQPLPTPPSSGSRKRKAPATGMPRLNQPDSPWTISSDLEELRANPATPTKKPRRNSTTSEDQEHATSGLLFSHQQLKNHREDYHRWSQREREILCVLRSVTANDWHEIAQLMNAYFKGTGRRPFTRGTVSAYWGSLRLQKFGAEVTDMFVFITQGLTADQARIRYQEDLSELEQIAHHLGFSLISTPQANASPSSRCVVRATRPRSSPRRLHKSNDLGSHSQLLGPRVDARNSIESSHTSVAPSGSRTQRRILDQLEVASMHAHDPRVEPSTDPFSAEALLSSFPSFPYAPGSQPKQPRGSSLQLSNTRQLVRPSFAQTIPKILFRFYDGSSAGINGPSGFRACRYSATETAVSMPVEEPPTPDDLGLLWDASYHLTRTPVGSRLISATPSLVWAFHKAFKCVTLPTGADEPGTGSSKEAYISLIDGPSANSHTRVYETQPIIKALREGGWLQDIRYKYKGTAEYLVWAEIKAPSITGVISTNDIEAYVRRWRGVRRLLRLDTIRQSTSINSLRKSFAQNPISLDAEIGLALGKLLHLFGIRPTSDNEAIAQLVYNLAQGWAVRVPVGDEGDDAIEGVRQAFLIAFAGSEEFMGLQIEARVRAAFNEGLKKAGESWWRTQGQG
jgi:hypothetical protein